MWSGWRVSFVNFLMPEFNNLVRVAQLTNMENSSYALSSAWDMGTNR